MLRTISALFIIGTMCGALTGCLLTRQGPDGSTPAGRAASGAAAGFVSGGPIGALVGGLGGLVTGLGAAVQQRRSRDRIIRQVVMGVGQHIQGAPVNAYHGLSPDEIVAAERQRLLGELSRVMDAQAKGAVLKVRQQVGAPLNT